MTALHKWCRQQDANERLIWTVQIYLGLDISNNFSHTNQFITTGLHYHLTWSSMPWFGAMACTFYRCTKVRTEKYWTSMKCWRVFATPLHFKLPGYAKDLLVHQQDKKAQQTSHQMQLYTAAELWLQMLAFFHIGIEQGNCLQASDAQQHFFQLYLNTKRQLNKQQKWTHLVYACTFALTAGISKSNLSKALSTYFTEWINTEL